MDDDKKIPSSVFIVAGFIIALIVVAVGTLIYQLTKNDFEAIKPEDSVTYYVINYKERINS